MTGDDRYQRVNLRIPKDLHRQIMEAADARSRSMNAEIITRLERSISIEKMVEEEKSTPLGEYFIKNPEDAAGFIAALTIGTLENMAMKISDALDRVKSEVYEKKR